jgi:hypothetical protein
MMETLSFSMGAMQFAKRKQAGTAQAQWSTLPLSASEFAETAEGSHLKAEMMETNSITKDENLIVLANLTAIIAVEEIIPKTMYVMNNAMMAI